MWEPIKGYEGLYEVSDKGLVRSLDRIVPCGKGRVHGCKGRILTGKSNGKGYLFVALAKNGKLKKHYIHRIVAEAFVENPDNFPIVNHKDENPANNEAGNLEWCTHKYNVNYGECRQKIVRKQSKRVVQIFSDGTEKEWESTHEAERITGINHSNISACCRGIVKTAGKCVWRYVI